MRSTRREFLAWLTKATAVGAAFPLLHGCGGDGGSLPFDGELAGEDPTWCHSLRDGALTLPAAPAETPLLDVLIVGGGAAGAAAAWRLERAGVRSMLLIEKEAELGGTSMAGKGPNGAFAWGAHYVEAPPPDARYLLDIYEDLGVIIDMDGGWPIMDPQYVVPPLEAKLLAGNEWAEGLFPYALASSSDVSEYERFRQDLYRWSKWRGEENRPAFGRPLEALSAAEEPRRLDEMTMLEYLDSLGVRSKLVQWLVNNRMMDEYGLTLDQVSAWSGVQFWAQSNSSLIDFEPPLERAPQTLSWREGNSFLVKGMARRLRPDQLSLGTIAVQIERTAEGVQAALLDVKRGAFSHVKARQAVFAAPKHTAPHVIPELKTAGRTEFERLEYVPWLTAAVHLSSGEMDAAVPPSWETLAFDGWGLGYIDNGHLDADRPFGAPRTLTFYAALTPDIHEQRSLLLKEGWEFWARVVLEEMERMHPNIRRQIERIDIRKWGHAMAAARPGSVWGSDREAMRRPFGPIHFAGADIGGSPVFEQAARTGVQAAEAALSGLGRSYVSAL